MKLVASDRFGNPGAGGGDPTTVTVVARYGAATPSVSLTVPPPTFAVNLQLRVGAGTVVSGTVVRRETIGLP